MNKLCLLAPALLLVGCTFPEVRLAPPPSAEQVKTARTQRSRLIQVPCSTVFPRVLDLLVERGFQVRAVDRELGFVAFAQQWTDPGQFSTGLSLEATLLVRPEEGATRITLLLNGRWDRISSVEGGSASVSAQAREIDPEQYRRLLDLLEAGLRTGG